MTKRLKVKKRSRTRKLARTDLILTRFVASGSYEYWLAHGCNYLNSDLEEAHWSPLFPEIYKDDSQLSREGVVIRVNDFLESQAAEGSGISTRHSTLAAWACMDAETLMPFWGQIQKGIAELGVDPDIAMQGDVWHFFEDMVGGAAKWLQGREREEAALAALATPSPAPSFLTL